jgi:hypothetical protein
MFNANDWSLFSTYYSKNKGKITRAATKSI